MQPRNAMEAVQELGGAAGEQKWSSSRGLLLLLLLQNPAEASSHTQLGGHPAPPPSDATTQNRENAECGRNAARQAGRGGRGGGRGRQAPSRRELQNSASSYAADTLLPCSAAAAVILCQFCKYKYTNTNTSTQIQIHKYEYTNMNTQIQIHKYKYTDTLITVVTIVTLCALGSRRPPIIRLLTALCPPEPNASSSYHNVTIS